MHVIGERIARFVRVARSTGAAVFWVGLPVMRDGDLDANVQAMNAFYAAKMTALGVPYIETRSRSVDAHGRYDAYLSDRDGTPRLMRTGDGIHMTIPGYIRLIRPLAERLRGDAALVWRRAEGATLPPLLPAATPSPAATAAPSASPRPSPTVHTVSRPAAETERMTTARANRREADRTAPAPTSSPSETPSPAASATPDAEPGKTAKANRREGRREKAGDPTPEPTRAAEP